MPKFYRIVCGLCFHSAAFERCFLGERDGASFGAGAGADGRKFQLSRAGGAKGASSCRTVKAKPVSPFLHSRQKFQHCSSWFEKLHCSGCICSIL